MFLLLHKLQKQLFHPNPAPSAPCCDLCDPSFLERFHFTSPRKQSRAPQLSKKDSCPLIINVLRAWHEATFGHNYPNICWDSTAFMDDKLINKLAAVEPGVPLKLLKHAFSPQWAYWVKYEAVIFAIVSAARDSSTAPVADQDFELISQVQTPSLSQHPCKRTCLAPASQVSESATGLVGGAESTRNWLLSICCI
jgi:hypothetical protein